MALSFDPKEQRILHGRHLKMIQKLLIHKIEQCQAKDDIKSLIWQTAAAMADIGDDEKKDEDSPGKISSLIDFDHEKAREFGMCSVGHICSDIRNITCSTPGCNIRTGQYDMTASGDLHHVGFMVLPSESRVFSCGSRQMSKLKRQAKLNDIKKQLILREVRARPSLSLDLLTGLSRKKGLDCIMEELTHRAYDGNVLSHYCVMLIDMDNLKALNSLLGHEGADGIIQKVGEIIKSHVEEVNEGMYFDKDNAENSMRRAWAFRCVHIVLRKCNMLAQTRRRRICSGSAVRRRVPVQPPSGGVLRLVSWTDQQD